MSEPCCAATNAAGEPCAARPLPESDFCLFHDPAHQPALAESRAKGGAAPRRRARRFPRILDHVHVAELLGELLIDALNNPTAVNAKRLSALTHLCQVLLKAVGNPKGSFLFHRPHPEPAATEEHLCRVYPAEPAAPDLVPDAAEHPTPNTEQPTPHPERLIARPPERLNRSGAQTLHVSHREAYRGAAPFFLPEPDSAVPAAPAPKSTAEEVDAEAERMCAEFERRFRTPPSPLATGHPEPDWYLPASEQVPEQDTDRSGTGAPATSATPALATGSPGFSAPAYSVPARAPHEPDLDCLPGKPPEPEATPDSEQAVPPKAPPTGPPRGEPPALPPAGPRVPAGPLPFLRVAGFVRRSSPHG